ncbi:MAG: ATP-binding cassette domain-containing protein, partial [Candidatus Deferrimicrobiaceae bacterium]
VGLADEANRRPPAMSGGQQQRVAVARAVVHDPVLLLADEPTGSLDAETGTRVLELLLELTRNERRTMVIVTHSDAVARVTDRVLVLQGVRLEDETLSGGAPV